MLRVLISVFTDQSWPTYQELDLRAPVNGTLEDKAFMLIEEEGRPLNYYGLN